MELLASWRRVQTHSSFIQFHQSGPQVFGARLSGAVVQRAAQAYPGHEIKGRFRAASPILREWEVSASGH